VGVAVEVLVLVLESVEVVVMVASPITIAGLAHLACTKRTASAAGSEWGALKIRLNDLHGYSGFGHLVSPFYQA
jgi:hypothetical protein